MPNQIKNKGKEKTFLIERVKTKITLLNGKERCNGKVEMKRAASVLVGYSAEKKGWALKIMLKLRCDFYKK